MADKLKIIIIDDEEIVLDSCVQILEGSDYEVATAKDGVAGLELIREMQPDLVYIDLKMPGISGFEVLDKIREQDPTLVSIVITGYATVSSAVEAMKKGAYDFLPKPFTPEEFRLITRRSAEKRRLVLETIALRREKEMLKDQFAAIISHELKSPLNAVQQNFYTLVDDLSEKLTESQMNQMKRIQARIDGLMDLIHTWLRVITTDIEKIKESFEPIHIEEVILSAIENVQTYAIRKDIQIVSEISKPVQPIMGDEVTLTEALVNLLENAIKYSYMGNRVVVEAKEREDYLMISVSDSGVGIAEEDLPYIFEDFFSGKPAPQRERSTGLGLAITRRIVEAHHGQISVTSQLGKGSTFTIQIPTYFDETQTLADKVLNRVT
jgi:two-component system, sensor histidine kinase and response regulator